MNALSKSPYLSAEKEKILNALEKMGLSADIRGEKMSIEQFAELSDILCD